MTNDVQCLIPQNVDRFVKKWNAKEEELLSISLQLPKAKILESVKQRIDKIPERFEDGKKQ